MIEGRRADPLRVTASRKPRPPWAIKGLGGADATPSSATKEGVDSANLA